MKKLLLTSKKLDKLSDLITNSPQNVKVAFIPTAGDPYENKWFVDEDREKLKKAGFQLTDVDLKNTTKDELMNALADSDVIFVSGGNTFYLLEKVKESGFDKVILSLIEKGVIYVGSSAGAILAGPSIEPAKDLDDPSKAPNLKSYEGLGLVDFIILPHYGKEKYKEKYQKIMDEYGNGQHKLVLITDEQSIIVEGDSYKIK